MAGPGDRIEESSLRSRPARLDEGGELTELAMRAKSHWGYDPVFLDAARADLTIDAETISSARSYVLDHEGTTIGCHGLVGEPPRGRLEWNAGITGRRCAVAVRPSRRRRAGQVANDELG